MKREFIKGLLPDISDDILSQIMDEHSKDIGQYKSKVSALETEREGLKTQLEEANKSIKSYQDMDIDGIKKAAADWEAKYNADTKSLQEKLDAQAYGYAVEGIAAKEHFSSRAAKAAFVADLTKKGLKLEDGKLIGYDDFLKGYKESDPDAFVPEDNGDNGQKNPSFVAMTHGGGGDTMSAMRTAFGLPDKKE